MGLSLSDFGSETGRDLPQPFVSSPLARDHGAVLDDLVRDAVLAVSTAPKLGSDPREVREVGAAPASAALRALPSTCPRRTSAVHDQH
jgi:hypothetical protein